MRIYQLACWTVAFAAGALGDWSIRNGQLSLKTQGQVAASHDFGGAPKPFAVGSQADIEVTFQAAKDGKPARAHQNVVLVTDPATGASLSYVAKVRPNGSAKVTISNSNFPGALRDTPLDISAIVASFGDENPTKVDVASNVIFGRTSEYKKPARFEMLPEIKHVFRTKPHTVNPVIALAFAGGAVFLLLATLAVFASNGVANISKALSTSPIGHLGLVSSLVAYEAVFLLYYLGNSIFTTLGAAAVITPIAVYTGSRALREVAARRRSGQFR